VPCFEFECYPCGKCAGCLSKRSSDWAIRLTHEKKSHSEASFITLTHSDDNVVDVEKHIAQEFLRRLRKKLAPKKIRFYLVSEYGEKGHRPHYHAIIFGHDFSRDDGAAVIRRGLYSSPLLEAAWGLGHVSSGEVTDASIKYVTNYILQKEDVPSVFEIEKGFRKRLPVFALMSRNPGIGSKWIASHCGETYRDDNVVVSGLRLRPPRFYDIKTFGEDVESMKALRQQRRSARLAEMIRSPGTYLDRIQPARRIAAKKIFESRRRMTKSKGEI